MLAPTLHNCLHLLICRKCTTFELLILQSSACAVQHLVDHVRSFFLSQASDAQAHAMSLNSLFGIKQK